MSEEAQIRSLLGAYQTSLNSSDTEQAVSCYTADGMFMPTTLPTAQGQELSSAYQAIFTTIRLDVTFTIDELVVTGEGSAYALTRSHGTQTVLSSGVETAESNREIFIFAKQGGSWGIDRYMFNKPV